MKLTCMMQVFNENTHKGHDGKTNIERCLNSIIKYCDSLVIYDDKCIDNTMDLVRSYKDLFEDLIIIEGTENNFTNELAHKQECLNKCREINSTHIMWLDADEVVEFTGENGGVRHLCESMIKGAVNFYQKNLWRTDRHIRVDELWDIGLFCRLWQVTPELRYEIKSGLHHDLVPRGIIGRETTQLKIIHYGFETTDSILRKYYTYKSHGQKGNDLKRLIDESSLRIAQVQPKWFGNDWQPSGPTSEVYSKPLRSLM